MKHIYEHVSENNDGAFQSEHVYGLFSSVIISCLALLKSGPEVIILFLCSNEIETEIAKFNGNFRFKSQAVIYPAGILTPMSSVNFMLIRVDIKNIGARLL